MQRAVYIAKELLTDCAGQDLVEYALLLGVFGLVCVASMRGIAQGVTAVFSAVGAQLTGNV
jgi:Flp pilus assembly pilin Flp